METASEGVVPGRVPASPIVLAPRLKSRGRRKSPATTAQMWFKSARICC